MMERVTNFIKKIDTDWIKTIASLLGIWLLFNVAVVGFKIFTEGNMFGKTNFFQAFLNLLVIECILFIAIAIFVLTIYFLFRKPIKKLREKT